MPKIHVDVPHSLSHDEAVERLKSRFQTVKDNYQEHITSLDEEWDGNAMSFRLAVRGATITGNVAVDPSEVKVDAQLPLAASLFKSKIESQIRESLTEMLG